jgi:hypothetical protein
MQSSTTIGMFFWQSLQVGVVELTSGVVAKCPFRPEKLGTEWAVYDLIQPHHFNMLVRVNVTWLVTPAGAPLYR